jgi:hypothetical protein
VLAPGSDASSVPALNRSWLVWPGWRLSWSESRRSGAVCVAFAAGGDEMAGCRWSVGTWLARIRSSAYPAEWSDPRVSTRRRASR